MNGLKRVMTNYVKPLLPSVAFLYPPECDWFSDVF